MKNRIKRICQICNKEFLVIPHIVKIGKGKFCSRKCADINHKTTFAGRGNPAWRGGRMKSERGYILIKVFNHPNADVRGYIPEHRLVMEQHLGRYLQEEEVIHHKNGIKNDNKIENLELFENHSQHMIHHMSDSELRKHLSECTTRFLKEVRYATAY